MATMAKTGSLRLHGRFTPGSQVRLVKVDGAHVMRPGPADETVDTQEVDKDGWVEFSGVQAGERYFAVGLSHGQPVEVRLTGKSNPDDSNHAEMYGDNGLAQRTKLTDGTFLDEPPEQHQTPDVEGATWQGQHQVPKGTVQRSDTPRGAATVISAEELERAGRQHRKQEPTEPVVEANADAQEDPEDAPARTSKPAAKKPATTSKKKGA